MGSFLAVHCESCCERDNRDIQIDKNQVKKFQRNSKNKKINLQTVTTTENNGLMNSFNSESNFNSISVDNSPKKQNTNNIKYISDSLVNSHIYQKMIKGERLHNILELIINYDNCTLFLLVMILLDKIKEINNTNNNEINLIENSETKNLHLYYLNYYQNLIDKYTLYEIQTNMEEDSTLKYNIIFIIESCVELYHYFIYKLSQKIEPYNKNYWEQYKNCNEYMKQVINGIKEGLININLSIGDNKLKIIG